MTDSAFTTHPYSSLKNEFINTMEKSISDNQEAKLSQFADDNEILKHRSKIVGWNQSLEAFKKLCNFLENPPAPPQTTPNDTGAATMDPIVIEGEIVE